MTLSSTSPLPPATRDVRIVDGRRIIQLATTTATGVPVTRRLTFERAD